MMDAQHVIMEHAGDRNLQTVINDPFEELNSDRRTEFSFKIATALQFIHQQALVHLDLKPGNVLVTGDDHCKPYGNENQHVVIFGVVAYHRRPELSEEIAIGNDEQYVNLVRQCWETEASFRPAVSDIVCFCCRFFSMQFETVGR